MVTIKKECHIFNHQYKNGIIHMPKLIPIVRRIAILERRSGADISIDITVTLWTAVQDGKLAVMHPIVNITYELLNNIDTVRPKTNKIKDKI